jgi:hypothetical protein
MKMKQENAVAEHRNDVPVLSDDGKHVIYLGRKCRYGGIRRTLIPQGRRNLNQNQLQKIRIEEAAG